MRVRAHVPTPAVENPHGRRAVQERRAGAPSRSTRARSEVRSEIQSLEGPVSYTHLTLPTIYSV